MINDNIVHTMQEKWNDLGFKDKAQYITAMILIASGIIIAFVAFFMTLGIPSTVLIYIAQAFVAGGAIFGVSIYFKSQLAEVRGQATNTIQQMIEDALKKLEQKDMNKE